MPASTPAADIYGSDTVFELRQYTLFGGMRDTLIDVFEDKFIEPQDELGARVVATFRDLDAPDRFVWMRGFRDMSARKKALETFYGGPVWKENRSVANATMVDSDNVLLLRRGDAAASIPLAPLPADSLGDGDAIYAARIFSLGAVEPQAFAELFAAQIEPLLVAEGAAPVGRFITEPAENNFPMLPVRDDRVFVWLARFPSEAAEEGIHRGWSDLDGWRDKVPEPLLPALFRKPERLRLAPTSRSPLR